MVLASPKNFVFWQATYLILVEPLGSETDLKPANMMFPIHPEVRLFTSPESQFHKTSYFYGLIPTSWWRLDSPLLFLEGNSQTYSTTPTSGSGGSNRLPPVSYPGKGGGFQISGPDKADGELWGGGGLRGGGWYIFILAIYGSPSNSPPKLSGPPWTLPPNIRGGGEPLSLGTQDKCAHEIRFWPVLYVTAAPAQSSLGSPRCFF